MSILGEFFESENGTKKVTTVDAANHHISKGELNIAKSRVQKCEVGIGMKIVKQQKFL